MAVAPALLFRPYERDARTDAMEATMETKKRERLEAEELEQRRAPLIGVTVDVSSSSDTGGGGGAGIPALEDGDTLRERPSGIRLKR